MPSLRSVPDGGAAVPKKPAATSSGSSATAAPKVPATEKGAAPPPPAPKPAPKPAPATERPVAKPAPAPAPKPAPKPTPAPAKPVSATGEKKPAAAPKPAAPKPAPVTERPVAKPTAPAVRPPGPTDSYVPPAPITGLPSAPQHPVADAVYQTTAEERARQARAAAWASVQERAAIVAQSQRDALASKGQAEALRKAAMLREEARLERPIDKLLDPKTSMRDVEKILTDAQRAQVASGGKSFDGRLVAAAATKYMELHDQQNQQFTDQVDAINKLWTNGKDKKSDAEAVRLYNSKAFQALLAEHQRVNGKAGDLPRGVDDILRQGVQQGAFVDFVNRYNAMKTYQEQYVGSILERQASAERQRLARFGDREINIQNPPGVPVQYETRFVEDPKTGALVRRQVPVTVEDRAARAQEQLVAEYQRARADFEATQRRQRQLGEDADTANRYDKTPRLTSEISKAMDVHGISSDALRQGGVENLVNAAMSDWSTTHRPGDIDPRIVEFLRGGGRMAQYALNQLTPEQRKAYANWMAAYDGHESELYGYFGATKKSAIDRAMEVPGVNEALTLLNAPLGVVGTAVRQAGAALGGEFSFDPTRVFDPRTVLGASFDNSSIAKSRAITANQDFWNAYNATGSDGLARLRLVGNYGSNPFKEEDVAGNVLFQVFADPTNLIPLKVTTYPARLAAASAKAAGKVGKVEKAATFLSEFRTVSEAELRRSANLGDALGKLGVQDAKRVASDVLSDVYGLTAKDAHAQVRAKIAALGLDTSAQNTRQLLSLAQAEIDRRLAAEGAKRVTQVDKGVAAKASRDAAESARVAKAKAAAATAEAARKGKAEAKARRAETALSDMAKVRADLARSGKDTGAAAAAATGMGEEAWLRLRGRELSAELKATRDATRRRAITAELAKISDGLEAIKNAKAGRMPGEASVAEAKAFANQVVARYGSDAVDLFEPRRVGRYAEDAAQAAVEQARQYRSMLGRSVEAPGGPSGFLDLDKFIEADAAISKAFNDAGITAQGVTHIGRERLSSVSSTVRAADHDPVRLAIKTKVLDSLGVNVEAYDQARAVLRDPYVTRVTSERIATAAKAAGGDVRAGFLARRGTLAAREAKLRLGKLARSMYGHSPEEVMAEFTSLHTYRGQARRPLELTAFQRRTLEQAWHKLTGVDLRNADAVRAKLSEGGVVPPMTDRAAYRAHMESIGQWTPRSGKKFLEGEPVWSIAEEAKFHMDEHGAVPPWADMRQIEARNVLHDADAYQTWQREVGGFDASFAASTAGKGGKSLREAVINPPSGVKGKADLAAERRFVIERFGEGVVTDGKGNLTAFPWLMKPAELASYYAKRIADNLPVDKTLVPPEALGKFVVTLQNAIDHHWQRVKDLPPGAPVESDFVLRFAYDVVDDLVASKEWLPFFHAQRGPLLARGITAWSALVRASITWNFSFFAINVPDLYSKTAWSRFVNRRVITGTRSARAVKAAEELVSEDFTSFYSRAGRKGVEKLRDPLFSRAARDRVEGAFEALAQLPGEMGGRLEIGRKRYLAGSMFDGAFDDALAGLAKRGVTGDAADELADAIARRYVKREIDRIFPSMENAHPVWKLFNELSPFLNYQMRNSLFWVGEAAAHPAMLNHLLNIGKDLEAWNRREWAKDHPEDPEGATMPANLVQRVPLPWAPDVFLDLSTLTDAGRGLYTVLPGKKGTITDLVAHWVRAVSPATQAAFNGVLDANGIGGRWVYIWDERGYHKEWRGIGEPWSGDPVGLASFFWPADAAELIDKLLKDGTLDAGDIYQMIGKFAFYSEFARLDPLRVTNDTYFLLKDKSPDAAADFLAKHPELRRYWQANARPHDFAVPGELADWFRGLDPDRKSWYQQPREWREQVKTARDGLSALIDDYDGRLRESGYAPGSRGYQQLKAERRQQIAAYYLAHPELIEANVLSMTNDEWAARQDQFELDDRVNQYFAVLDAKPRRTDFASLADYQAAVRDWEHQKATFLAAYPQVSDVVGRASNAVAAVAKDIHETWGKVLDDAAKHRAEAEQAQARKDYAAADFASKLVDLDFQRLDFDAAASYFSDRDLQAYDKIGPRQPIAGRLKTITLIPDFDANRWAKATPAERVKMQVDQRYGEGMTKLIAGAKTHGTFDPAKFVANLKKDPWLLGQYFARNPGKREEWKANETYIAAMKKWSSLFEAGRWDEANRYFDNLPADIKARYYAAHPDAKAKQVAGKQYANAMSHWYNLNKAQRFDEARAYFSSLPGWMKDRYYAKHPDAKVKAAATQAYLGYMDRWAKLRDKGDWEAANAYFDKLPGWVKSRYFAKPGRKEAFDQARKYAGAMDHWTTLIGAKKFAEAEKYFNALPKWMQDKYYNDPKHGAERRKAREYRDAMAGWTDLIAAGKSDEARAYFDRLPGWVKDRYYNDPEAGPERRKSRDYQRALEPWAALVAEGRADEANALFERLPKWVKDRYYNDPVKGAERRATRDYAAAMQRYTTFLDGKDYAGADAYFGSLPDWMKERYYNDPVKGPGRQQSRDYRDALGPWIAKLDGKDFDGAKAYFDALPEWMRLRYFADHPEHRGPGNTYKYADKTGAGRPAPGTMIPGAPGAVLQRPVRFPPRTPAGPQSSDYVNLDELDGYFRVPFDQQADYLAAHPAVASYLASHTPDDKRYKLAVVQGYQAIPKTEPWLQRIYRERYPDVYSDEAIAAAKLAKVQKRLDTHPELRPAYEKFLALVRSTYGESLKHHLTRPVRDVEMKRPKRRRKSNQHVF